MYLKYNQKKCLECIGEKSIDIQGEGNKKRGQGERVGMERQQMHGEIMIQDQRAKVAVTWTMVGGGKVVLKT